MCRANPSFLALGDFNLDSRTDLALAYSSTDTVSVLLGNGDGTFRSPASFPVGRNPIYLAVGDINGDGIPDLAAANSGSNNVSVLLGLGNGSFQAAFNFTAGASPSAVALGDFNGDGLTDLAVSNANSNNVSVLANSGGILKSALEDPTITPEALVTFFKQFEFGVGSNPVSVATGDFNADGRLDIVTADRNGNDVSVLINNTPAAAPAPAP